MTNPRNRNMVRESAFATAPATLPAIPIVTTEDRSVAAFARAVKQVLDARTGVAGNPFERMVLQRDLHDLGLAPGRIEATAPADTLGIPVWTSRGQFTRVTPEAFAGIVQAFLEGSTTEVDDALDDLRRRMAQIQPGVTAHRAAAMVRAAVEQLRAVLRTEIAQKIDTTELQRRLDELDAKVRQAQHIALQDLGRLLEVTDPATVWNVAHNLDRFPVITVLNNAAEKIEPDVEYIDRDNLTVTHGRAMTGWVILR